MQRRVEEQVHHDGARRVGVQQFRLVMEQIEGAKDVRTFLATVQLPPPNSCSFIPIVDVIQKQILLRVDRLDRLDRSAQPTLS